MLNFFRRTTTPPRRGDKHHLARRAHPLDCRAMQGTDAQAPRTVILEACRDIASALAGDGFAFTPSGPKITRKAGAWRSEISLQSDRNNAAGFRAAVWPHLRARSVAFNQWREQRGLALGTVGDVVVHLGNLCEPRRWVTWDFADRARRPSVVTQAVAAIRAIAFPFFARFEDIEGLISAMETGRTPWPPVSDEHAVELALWHRGAASAEKVGAACLRRNDADFEIFDKAVRVLRASGLPARRTPNDLAFLAVKENLSFVA